MLGSGRFNILLVEDSAADEMIIRHQLKKEKLDCDLTRVETLEAMKTELENNDFDIVLSDFRLPRFSGIAALQYVRENHGGLPFIMVSGALGDEMAADMIKKGATDFLLKDRLVRLGTAIEKAMEEYRLLKEKKDKEEMLELISYIISHDLRSPVNNASALIELVNEDHLKGEAREIWPRIERSIDSLKETLDDLVTITIAGKSELEQVEQFNLTEILEEVQTDLQKHIEENDAVINTDVQEVELESNRAFLKSILSNLISNSLKYRHDDRSPEIDIKARTNGGGYVLLEISDNGKGMNAEDWDVFKPFKQIVKNKKGFGLGLYITKKQVDRLKGEIALESRENEGTTFKITIPQKQISEEA